MSAPIVPTGIVGACGEVLRERVTVRHADGTSEQIDVHDVLIEYRAASPIVPGRVEYEPQRGPADGA